MESPCTLLIHAPDRQEAPNVGALKALLQNGTVQEKIAAMKQTIVLTVNGEAPAGLPIVIFQCIMTQRDHTLKKLLLLYLEVCEKTNKEGKLLPEMILVWCAPFPWVTCRSPLAHLAATATPSSTTSITQTSTSEAALCGSHPS